MCFLPPFAPACCSEPLMRLTAGDRVRSVALLCPDELPSPHYLRTARRNHARNCAEPRRQVSRQPASSRRASSSSTSLLTTPRGSRPCMISRTATISAAPLPGKTFVGPAERVRRDDDVVELVDRLVGGRRLDLEHIEPRAGDRARRSAPGRAPSGRRSARAPC